MAVGGPHYTPVRALGLPPSRTSGQGQVERVGADSGKEAVRAGWLRVPAGGWGHGLAKQVDLSDVGFGSYTVALGSWPVEFRSIGVAGSDM